MAKRKSRRTSRGAPETAKRKQWYTIRAPRLFDGKPLGETLAEEPEKLPGRVTEVTLQDLTGDFNKSHVKIRFRVAGVRGTEAQTKFQGHELTTDYLRRLTRRQQSKIDDAYDVTTQDGYVIRVKPTAITERRCQTTQEQAIRRIAREQIEETAEGMRMGEFVAAIVNGDLASEIYQEARSIYPIKRVEIRKSEVIQEPEDIDLEEEVFPEETLEEEEEEEAEDEEAPDEEPEEEPEEAPDEDLEEPEEPGEAPDEEPEEPDVEAADEEPGEPAEEAPDDAAAEDVDDLADAVEDELEEGVDIDADEDEEPEAE